VKYPVTPDGRYFVVRGRLWRCTNPELSEERSAELRRELMAGMRLKAKAKRKGDHHLWERGRAEVDRAKRALGERGPVWWDDDTDYGRRMARNTPYAEWFAGLNV